MRTAINELTEDPVVLRIMEELKLQKKTEKSLLTALGLPNSMFSSWKYKNGKSYIKHIDRIAEFLGVSKYYLLEGTDEYINMNTLTATEIKVLRMFRQMGSEQQKCYMKMGKFMVESTEHEQENKEDKE